MTRVATPSVVPVLWGVASPYSVRVMGGLAAYGRAGLCSLRIVPRSGDPTVLPVCPLLLLVCERGTLEKFCKCAPEAPEPPRLSRFQGLVKRDGSGWARQC